VVRLGVVGGGLITQVAHLPALRALDDRFQLAALADPSARVRDVLAARYAIPEVFASHGAMLERARLDAVLVCSPSGTHAEVALDALDAGLHVLVEKPLCLTQPDAAAIAERARRTGRVVQVGYMKRFDPAYEALLDHLPAAADLRLVTTTTVDPAIGERLRPSGFVAPGDVAAAAGREAREVTARQVAAALGSDDPRHVKPFSEAFLGALIHDVNLVLGLLDAIGAGAQRVTDAIGGYDGSLAYGAVELSGGARWTAAWMLLPGGGAFREDVRLFAADGVRSLAFPAPYHGSAPTELRVDGESSRSWLPAADNYVRELEHFHACVTEGVPCRTPAEQGARDVALLTELYQMAMAA
jgi:predicted dehydrogenase